MQIETSWIMSLAVLQFLVPVGSGQVPVGSGIGAVVVVSPVILGVTALLGDKLSLVGAGV